MGAVCAPCAGKTEADERNQRLIELICTLEDAEGTSQIVNCLSAVYEEAYAKAFTKKFKGLSEELKDSEENSKEYTDKENLEEESEESEDEFYGSANNRDGLAVRAAAESHTATEVRKLRNKRIAVLGVFAGEEEDLQAEKKIFGRDFAYIRDIGNFANVVGRYLKRQLLDV